MIREFSINTKSKTLTVKCDEHLASQANWLLETVAGIAERSGGLKNEETIRLSWTILTVKENASGFALHEPDFLGNPFENTVDSVNQSLIVLAQQNDVLNKLNIAGEPVLFSDKIVYAKNCLSSRKVYLERTPVVSENDSGWYIGDAENRIENPELAAMHVYQLLEKRPALMSVISLAPGALVVFDGDEIEAVLDEDSENIWK